jgi:hypothetical protein
MTDTERPADLLFWFADGACGSRRARLAADTEVSIGRTNSKRALGFLVSKGDETVIDFVLDRDQVAELAGFLQLALPRLRKPLGRKQPQMSLAALSSPKHRLYMALEGAATAAHPGWHRINDRVTERDAGAPSGAKLVAWFKRTHPHKAARIERRFVKQMLEG